MPQLKITGTPDNFNSSSLLASSTTANESAMNINESSLGGWSTAASTPMGGANLTGGISGMQISGINFLNSTTDSDIGNITASNITPSLVGNVGLKPAPIKPKNRRFKAASNTSIGMGGGSNNHNGSIPLFGLGSTAPGGGGSPLCRTNGFTIRTLEFSVSPQILLLTPTPSSAVETSNISNSSMKPKLVTTPFPPKFPMLIDSPLAPCSRYGITFSDPNHLA
jgi:hypothetical protein